MTLHWTSTPASPAGDGPRARSLSLVPQPADRTAGGKTHYRHGELDETTLAGISALIFRITKRPLGASIALALWADEVVVTRDDSGKVLSAHGFRFTDLPVAEETCRLVYAAFSVHLRSPCRHGRAVRPPLRAGEGPSFIGCRGVGQCSELRSRAEGLHRRPGAPTAPGLSTVTAAAQPPDLHRPRVAPRGRDACLPGDRCGCHGAPASSARSGAPGPARTGRSRSSFPGHVRGRRKPCTRRVALPEDEDLGRSLSRREPRESRASSSTCRQTFRPSSPPSGT